MAITMLILALLTLPMAAVDITGKWTGTLEGQASDGTARTRPAFMIFKQEGTTVTGSGGPNESEQHPIANAKLDGDKLTFEVPLQNGSIFANVQLTETEIKGEMEMRRDGSSEKVKVSLKRVPK